MAERPRRTFFIRKKRGVSVWTDGPMVFEVTPGSDRTGSLWVGIDGGKAYFWMTPAQARRLANFILDGLAPYGREAKA